MSEIVNCKSVSGVQRRIIESTYTVKQRLFGPMLSHAGMRLGLIGRCFYGWLYSDDPYFERLDKELKSKGK